MARPCRLRAARANGLYERAFGAQEAFLVGVEDRHQGDLGHVEALAEQVDADEDVELAEPQVAHDFHALHRIDVGVQVAYADTVLIEVLGEIFGHPLGQRRHQHPLARRDRDADLLEEVVHLGRCRPNVHRRVDKARGPYQLFNDAARAFALVRSRRCGNEDHLRGELLPFVEPQRPVVERRRKPETVLHQRLLA